MFVLGGEWCMVVIRDIYRFVIFVFYILNVVFVWDVIFSGGEFEFGIVVDIVGILY